MRKKIAVVSTGGTIEKTYDEMSGILANHLSVLDILLNSLQVPNLEISRIALMNKDSRDMSESDHNLIAATAGKLAETADGVVIVHGTDRLQISGEKTHSINPDICAPVVFTGAMRPYELRNTDATQNITESLLAVQILPPGVYAVFHSQVLTFPGVIKDYTNSTFSQT